MSKNSNEDQLNNRLKNVFADLDQPRIFPGLSASSDLTGWIWEMDPNGIITGCSPDIEVFLETPAQNLIGKSLDSYSDFSLISANLPTDPNRALMPTMHPIKFIHSDGTLIPTESFLLAKLDEEERIVSWRGITSVQFPEPEPEVEPKAESVKKDHKDPFSGLATLDIVPEIPQPDLSVSDIWRESSMDTAPLSAEDLLEESKAFADSLKKQLPPTPEDRPDHPVQDEIETIRIPRKSEPTESIENPLDKWDPDELAEAAENVPINSLYGQPKGDDFPGWTEDVPVSEVQDIEAEDFPSEPVEVSPQDEIETIRYTKSPLEPEFTELEINEAEITPELIDDSEVELVELDEFDEDYETGELFPGTVDAFAPPDPISEKNAEGGYPGFPYADPAPDTGPLVPDLPSDLTESSGTWIPDLELPQKSAPFDTDSTSPTPGESTEVPTRPLREDEYPHWESRDKPETKELVGTEDPPDTRELDPEETSDTLPDELLHADHPAEITSTAQQSQQGGSGHLLPDLDISQEGLIDPEMDIETSSLDADQLPSTTPPFRRPTIDTASLIPSLLRGEATEEQQTQASQSIDEFLSVVESEAGRTATKELDTLSISDGLELSISRGVQELLKIVDENPDREWKEDELLLVEQVHTQLELALENANLFQQTQFALSETDERARQLRLLNQMSDQINQTEILDEIYGIVAEKARDIFKVDQATIIMLTDDFKHLQVAAEVGAERMFPLGAVIPLDDTPYEVVIRENRVFIPPDSMDLEWDEIKSLLSGPIAIGNNVLGALSLGSTHEHAFNDRDANFLNQLLSLMNASVENRRLFEQIESALSTTEEQARSLAELNKLSEEFSSATSVDEVLSLILDNLNKIIAADEWAFTTINQDKDTYQIFMSDDQMATLSENGEDQISAVQPLANTIVQRAAADRRTIIEFSCQDSSYVDVRYWSEQRSIQTVMATPLFAGSTLLGVLNVGSREISAYTLQDENIIQSIASLAGSTIENRRLFTQIQKRSQQLETSAEVSRVASTILDPAELLPRVIELIKDGYDLYYAGIFLIDETGDITGEPDKWAVLSAGSGEAGAQMVAAGHKLEIGSESMIGAAISNSQARIALNVGDEASFFANPYLPNTRSEMALPLTSRGAVLGALSIQSEVADAFSPEDITALQTMADQLANAIENARLFEQTEIRAEELTVLNEMARGFTQSMDVNELVRNTYEYTSRLMDAGNFSIVLYSAEDAIVENKLFVQDGMVTTPKQSRIKLGPGLTEWIIQNKLPVLIPSNAEEHIHSLGLEINEEIPKSWLGVPMLLGNEVTGVIAVQNYQAENIYNNHSLDLLIAVSSQAAVAIDNAQRFQETQTRARHEEILRRVTTQVHATTDPDAILRTAVREVSDALGKPAFVKLSSTEKAVELIGPPDPVVEPDYDPPYQPPAPGSNEPNGGSEER